MSYLDVPRIHFMGLFYTAPPNLNNTVGNFDLTQALDYDTGLYKYPDGTSQLFLSQCVVTSVAGTDGVLCSDFKSDSLVGASVTTPGPDTQKEDGKGGLYGFAKIVDLDPNMQFRTEVYGIRMYVDIEGGGGFSGELALAPQLRDLWFGRGNGGIAGVQIAVGTWHQRLTNLTWTNPTAPSPVYDALRERSSAGLDVKMGVDLFQTFRANEFTVGNRFGYGRLVASIGPATAGEPAQVVPGRRLYTPRTFDAQLAPAAAAKQLGKFEFTRQAAEEGMNTAEALGVVATGVEWNRTDFRVCDLQGGRSLLIMDLFNSAPLTTKKDGKFNTGGDVTVRWLDGTPLKNGAISFNYSSPDAATRKLKDVFWPTDAAIFQIELTADERKKISNTPIAIQAGGTTVVRENTNGLYLNIERASVRLEPDKSADLEFFSYEFGQPSAKLPAGLTFQTQLYDDDSGEANPTTIFSVSTPTFVRPGCFRMSLKTGPAQTLTPLRVPLDSFLCFLAASGSGYLVGEAMTLKPQTGPPTPPFLTLLFWQNHQVVDKPAWVPNIQPLMVMYARLFPGMKSILDISNLATVTANAAALKNRFQRERTDPGFMPVSRDMSPATVDMMLRFLDSLTKEQP
jgi:hypothetical protein